MVISWGYYFRIGLPRSTGLGHSLVAFSVREEEEGCVDAEGDGARICFDTPVVVVIQMTLYPKSLLVSLA